MVNPRKEVVLYLVVIAALGQGDLVVVLAITITGAPGVGRLARSLALVGAMVAIGGIVFAAVVMRGGRVTGEADPREQSAAGLARMMIGRELPVCEHPPAGAGGDVSVKLPDKAVGRALTLGWIDVDRGEAGPSAPLPAGKRAHLKSPTGGNWVACVAPAGPAG